MKSILFSISFLLLVNCSLFVKPERGTQVDVKKAMISQIETLSEFKATGIISLNFNNLELKANFVLFKRNNKLRFDVLQGGILGLSPTPQLQMCNNKKFRVFLPLKKLVYETEAIDPLPKFWQKLVNKGKIENCKEEGYSLTLNENIKFQLDNDLNIHTIFYQEFKLTLSDYTRHLPNKIEFMKKEDLLMEIFVEEWTFDKLKDSLFQLEYPPNVKTEKLSIKALINGKL